MSNRLKIRYLAFVLLVFCLLSQPEGLFAQNIITSGNWSVPGNWSLGHVPLPGEDVIINAGGVVNVDVAGSCNQLTLNAGASLAFTAAVSLNVAGPVSGNATSALSLNTGTLSTGGNFVFAGTFAAGSGTIIYSGAAAQNVEALAYYNLVFNGIGTKNLTGPTTVSNSVNFTDGVVNTLGQTFTVTNTAAGAVTGGDDNSYVSGSFRRRFPTGATAGVWRFPMGSGGYYPFSIVNPNFSTAVNEISVSLTAGNSGGTPDGTLVALDPNRYWNAVVTNGTFVQANARIDGQPPYCDIFTGMGYSTTVNGTYTQLASTVGPSGWTTSAPLAALGYFLFGATGSEAALITDSYGGILDPTPPDIHRLGRGITVANFKASLTASAGAVFDVEEELSPGVWTPVTNQTTTELTSLMRVHVESCSGSNQEDYDVGVEDPLQCIVTQTAINPANGVIDAVWDVEYPGGIGYDIPNQVRGAPFVAGNLSGQFRVLTDQNNLYLLVEVIDDNVIAGDGPSPYKTDDDGIEIFIDANNTKGLDYHTAPATINAWQLIFRNGDPVAALGFENATNGDALPAMTFENILTASGYAFEIVIPWANVGFSGIPSNGQLFGLDVGANDDDNGGVRDRKIAWYDTHVPDNAYQYPIVFGTLEITEFVPDLFVQNVSINPLSLNAGQQLNLQCDVTCGSAADASVATTLRVYRSADATYDGSDVAIADIAVGALNRNTSQAVNQNITIPANTLPGFYYLILVADADDDLTEDDETNNDAASAQFEITETANAVWNGTGYWYEDYWTPAIPGSSTVTTISTGTCIVDASYQCGDLTLKDTANLTVEAGQWLQVNGNFTIESTSAGTGSFINHGTLTVPTGSIFVQRHLRGCMCDYNYHYMAVPVRSAPFDVLKDRVYYYQENHGSYFMDYGWRRLGSGVYEPGRGYSAKVLNDTTLIYEAPDVDSLIAGDVNIAHTYTFTTATQQYEGWNLLGNPFTSTLDWEQIDAAGANLRNEIHFWNGAHYSAYISGLPFSGYGFGTDSASQYIPEMQGFFVKSKSGGGTLTLASTAQVHRHGQYYGGYWKKRKASSGADILRLRLAKDNLSEETLVLVFDEADSAYGEYDAIKMFSNVASHPQVYSYNPHDQSHEAPFYAINSLAPADSVLTVGIGISCAASGQYSFTTPELSFCSYDKLLLADSQLDSVAEMSVDNSYAFYHPGGTNNSRFHVIWLEASEEPDAAPDLEQPVYKVYALPGAIVVESRDVGVADVALISMQGRVVSARRIAQPHAMIEVPVSGIYLLRIQSGSRVVHFKVFVPD